MNVSELRLVVTTEDYDAAVAFYRDTLGLSESAEYLSEDQGRVLILDAGRATLEISDPGHAVYVDDV
jgi:catechol 2,3-dioxygenase-like lactoylglutathione lyase family enzyme